MLPEVTLSAVPGYLQFLWVGLDALMWGVVLAVLARLIKPLG
jgi:hypothetical protein